MTAETAARATAAPLGRPWPLVRRGRARQLAARGPAERPGSSRSYASIVRANVFTIFNLILAVAGGLMLVFGSWQDALFLGILVANSAIGITQEVRAKRALDRLSALVVPTASVVRDGEPRRLPREEVVVGDLASLEVFDLSLVEARTVATTVMVVVGWYLIVALEGSGKLRGAAVVTMCPVLAAVYVAVLLVPFARDFFALAAPSLGIVLIAAGGCLVAIGGVLTSDEFIPGRGSTAPAR